MTDEQLRLLAANTRLLILIGEYLNGRPEMLDAMAQAKKALIEAGFAWD